MSSPTTNNPTSQNSDEENITCYVRCRPLNQNEQAVGANCIEISNDQKSVRLKNNDNVYNYDKIFSDETNQQTIFREIGLPLVKKFLSGYNSTIFAYGQTGTGKTHTIIGPLDCLFDDSNDNFGLIPNILNYLFNCKEEATDIIRNSLKDKANKIDYSLSCSCIEIYQEHLIDLLSNSNNEFEKDDDRLKIREDPKKGMYIDNLTELEIVSAKKAKEALISGFKNRHVASTSMNRESSRSHLIYTLFLNSSFEMDNGLVITRTSRLHLVDLAGSERQKYTNARGERIKEAGNINKSLSILGNVINAVIEFNEGKTKFVPFRDSKLTYYLKDSIGGNSKTVIIGNISQSYIQINETQSTLNFIQRAKMIKNKAKIIENVNDTVKLLQNEIKNLKALNDELNVKINDLTKENLDNKKLIENLSKKSKSTGYKKARDLEDKMRQELVSEFRKNKDGINRGNIDHNEMEFENQNFNDFVSKNELKELFDKINHMLSFEDEINENFKFLDMNNVSSIENFLVQKEIYSTEIRNQIDDIINNKEFFVELKNSDVLKDKIKLFTLIQENKKLLQENNVYKAITDFFVKQTNIEEKKESLSKDIINQFIDTNKELIKFYKKNLDENNEYLLVQKSYIEKFKFQIEELKLQDERNNKMIDSIQNENFLLTMELSKYKENSKNALTASHKVEKNLKEIQEKNEDGEEDVPIDLNPLLQTKESEEFASRLRTSMLVRNKTYNKKLLCNSIMRKNSDNINLEEIDDVIKLVDKNKISVKELNEKFIKECDSHLNDISNERKYLKGFINKINQIFKFKNEDNTIETCINMMKGVQETLELHRLLINKKTSDQKV